MSRFNLLKFKKIFYLKQLLSFLVFSALIYIPVLTIAQNSQVSTNKSTSNLKTESRRVSTTDERIKRIESGLLPNVLYQNQLAPTRTIEAAMRENGVVGVSVAVPVAADTLFQAGSISKVITALVVLSFVERGKLDLDEDINKKLVSWKVPENEFTKTEKVTIRRLLTHSAGVSVHGFQDYELEAKLPTLRQILKGEQPAQNQIITVDAIPGSRWRYSGGGFMILQQLLSDITGKPFEQIAREIIFEPLGMKNSFFLQPLPIELRERAAAAHENRVKVKGDITVKPELGAAGLWTIPSDLALLVIELQKSRLGKSKKLFSKKMANEFFTAQIEPMGLGVMLAGNGRIAYFSHGGSIRGFRSEMVGSLEGGRGAVVMINSSGQPLLYQLTRSIANEYGWQNFLPKERAVIKLDAAQMENYAGEYREPGGDTPFSNATISMRGGRLWLNQEPLEAESPIDFFTSVRGAEITFSQNADGRMNGLKFKLTHQPFAPITMQKVK